MGLFKKIFQKSDNSKQNINEQNSMYADHEQVVSGRISIPETCFYLNKSCDVEYGRVKKPTTKMKMPIYDEKQSIKVLLSKEGVAGSKINEIISYNNITMYNSALKEIELIESQKMNIQFPYLFTERKIAARLCIKFIGNIADETEITELAFMYLLFAIGQIIGLNYPAKSIMNYQWDRINTILNQEPRNYNKIIKFFDSRVLSCFKYEVFHSNMELDEIMRFGYEFLRINSNGSSPGAFLYRILGEQKVKEIIDRIIQVSFDYNRLNLSSLLIGKAEDETFEKRYNTDYMKKHPFYPHCFIYTNNEIKQLMDDIKEITEVLENDKNVIHALRKNRKHLDLNVSNIDFSHEATKLDYHEFTPTGKTPKIPYQACFSYKKQQNEMLFLTISYDKKQQIVRFSVCITDSSKQLIISAKKIDDKLIVSSIKTI